MDSLDEQLLPSDPVKFVEQDNEPASKHLPPLRWRVSLIASFALNVVLVLYVCSINSRPVIYSPATNALEYVPKRFTNIWDKSPYNDKPSPVLDEAWDALYRRGVMQASKSQAALFSNKTARIPGDKDNYIFSFDVFHQLHCLNLLRQALHPEYYNDAYYAENGRPHPLGVVVEGHDGFDHLGHCLDGLRESLTCSADITPVFWAWDEAMQQTVPRVDVVHICRDYDKILEWAEEHVIQTPFDATVHLEN